MNQKLNQTILKDIINDHDETVDLLKKLCTIPAPLNGEEERAKFCKKWLEDNGAKGVYIDKELNVIFPLNCEDTDKISVFMAHTDTVFPDTSPMPMKEENGKLYCPGVGDDTANLAILMMAAKYIIKKGFLPDEGCLFVCNSGEEGLGNLKGSKAVMEAYKGKIKEVVSFDGNFDMCINYSVGSARYKVEIKTEGGHSFANFGNRNAIMYMSSLIDTLYKIKVPTTGTTTYNVGMIKGGTSVNTIAQQAEMLFEYRSDVKEHLDHMMDFFDTTIDAYRKMGIEIKAEILGMRPCMGKVDKNAQSSLESKIIDIYKDIHGKVPVFISGSTDCNIPFSMGIPACTVGAYNGAGAHTREEWVELESLKKGSQLAMAVILNAFRNKNTDIFE